MASAVTKSKKASTTENHPKQKAEMEHFRFSIIQMRAKDLLFKKCAKCKGFVKSVIIDPNGENDRWFCTQDCQKVISDVVFNFQLKLDVVNIENGEVFHIQAYDEKCEPFVGCTPKEYYKLSKEDPDITSKLEDLVRGMYIHFSGTRVRQKENELKVERLVLSVARDNDEDEDEEEGIIPIYKTFNDPDLEFQVDDALKNL